MKRIATATLGGQSWKIRRPKQIADAYADCCHATRTIRIEAHHDGLVFLNLLLHEALHAMLPKSWTDNIPESEEEDWVVRSASELTRLLARLDLLNEDAK